MHTFKSTVGSVKENAIRTINLTEMHLPCTNDTGVVLLVGRPLPVQAHPSVISMCGVSLLSILLVVASLLTVLHLYHLYKVNAFLLS